MNTSLSNRRARQSGFSLVELLIASFVMAIGLLGLTTLQIMSIRTAGSSARMQDAIRLAEQVLELAAAEGTQSFLGERFQDRAPAAPKYIGAGVVTDYFQYRTVGDLGGEKGTLIATGDPANKTFTVTVNQVELVPAGRGLLARITVQVDFIEGVDSAGAPAVRSVALTRDVTHA